MNALPRCGVAAGGMPLISLHGRRRRRSPRFFTVRALVPRSEFPRREEIYPSSYKSSRMRHIASPYIDTQTKRSVFVRHCLSLINPRAVLRVDMHGTLQLIQFIQTFIS